MIQIDKLMPFIKGKTAKTRVILYLIADGYPINKFTELTITDFNKIKFPKNDYLTQSIDLFLSDIDILDKDKSIFDYSGGRKMTSSSFCRLVSDSTEKVLGKPLTIKKFVNFFK